MVAQVAQLPSSARGAHRRKQRNSHGMSVAESPFAAHRRGEGAVMKITSKVRAGGIHNQHDETLVRVQRVRIKSGVRAGSGGLTINHNETLLGMR
jgi:hypothetical protein